MIDFIINHWLELYALWAVTFLAFTLHILTEDVMTSKYYKNGKTLKTLMVNHNRNSRERFRRGIKKVAAMKKQMLAGSWHSPTSEDKFRHTHFIRRAS
ncbi:MAG: hypothetical protein H8E32_05825 [Nitrospinae bacterium]|nr:hypothetical protein [Nitrospinota bacterium]